MTQKQRPDEIALGPSREPSLSFDALDSRPVRRWLLEQAPVLGYQVSCISIAEFHDRYFDTPSWRFHRAGLSLRARDLGDRRLAEARFLPGGAGYAAGLPDLSAELNGTGEPEFARDEGALGESVRAVAGKEKLDERLELNTRREVFLVGHEGADVLSLHLVSTSAPARGGQAAVSLARVEVLDVEEGRASEVAGFLDALQAACRLQPGGASTFQTVLFALGEGPGPMPCTGSQEVTASTTAAEAAYAVLRRQFERCVHHEPGTRLGQDIEELHDMRVSTRRMRAALRLFRAFLPVRVLSLNRELRWLASALGEVRDLDVQREQLVEWHSSLDVADRDALEVLARGIGKRRAAARRRLLRVLDSRRYERLVERAIRVLRQGPGRTPVEGRQPVLAVAPALITRSHKRIVKSGKRIEDTSPDSDLHALRIHCKRMRYALEFHATLYGDAGRRMIRTLVRLQDLLGDHQDACVAIDHLREIVASEGRKLPPRTVFVVGRLAERYARRARDLRAGFSKAFRPMRGNRWQRLCTRMESLALPFASRAAPPAPPTAQGDR